MCQLTVKNRKKNIFFKIRVYLLLKQLLSKILWKMIFIFNYYTTFSECFINKLLSNTLNNAKVNSSYLQTFQPANLWLNFLKNLLRFNSISMYIFFVTNMIYSLYEYLFLDILELSQTWDNR